MKVRLAYELEKETLDRIKECAVKARPASSIKAIMDEAIAEWMETRGELILSNSKKK